MTRDPEPTGFAQLADFDTREPTQCRKSAFAPSAAARSNCASG
ncbi:hypothetical protein [Variovorax sp. E3]|nr:hypothetical protein [Variovorax sp. E3]